MSRSVFYCRCGARLVGSERVGHRCPPGQRLKDLARMGVSLDPAGNLHFDVPGFLRYAGWPDTERNRDVAMLFLEEACAECFPETPVVKQ